MELIKILLRSQSVHTASETEIRCTANLALYGDGAREYDYRVFKDPDVMKVEITAMR